MQSHKMLLPDEPSISKSHKNKILISQHNVHMSGKKVSKKSANKRAPVTSQKPESSPSDLLGNEYRALRKKYLLLEEENFGTGKELLEVENEVKRLEEEKLGLLDELVVLEGLVDPLELQSNRFS